MKSLTFILLRNILFVICVCLFLQSIHAGSENAQIIDYHGIPGCTCFCHCDCCCDGKRRCEPSAPQNIVWHAFMKAMKEVRREGPYFACDLCLNVGYGKWNDCSMLSEYLDGISMLRCRLEKETDKIIELYRKYYSKPREAEKLKEEIDRVTTELSKAKTILEQASVEIIPLFGNILSSCPHKGTYNLALSYNEGLFYMMNGDFEAALDKINEFVQFAETSQSKERLLTSKIYQQQGESLLEIGLFHEAISALTKSIEIDPKNNDAYFGRAAAHFEVGDFDSAIQDYRSSEVGIKSLEVEPKTSSDFSTALLKSVLEGGVEAAVDFVPSLCNTVCGLGECLWCFTQTPIDSSVNFCNACYEAGEVVTEYVRDLDREAIEGLAEEVKQFYQQFDSLSDSEKGAAIGYCVGKYGVDIFAGGAALKCIKAVQKLKTANRLANLEALASSETSKEAIKAAALSHAAEREAFFKNVKIHWDKQNKHVPGKHNFESGKSVLDHKDPKRLLEAFAGKGKPVKNTVPGSPNYKEVVDFQEPIGFWTNKENTAVVQTTRGTIHYSNDGAHIVPAHPDIQVLK